MRQKIMKPDKEVTDLLEKKDLHIAPFWSVYKIDNYCPRSVNLNAF